ncbi:MAG: hypothetical protein Q8P18_30610 [Pseudomonadota bacterium]|nr:hypothetical protein [Pseudomonadota bacterium]
MSSNHGLAFLIWVLLAACSGPSSDSPADDDTGAPSDSDSDSDSPADTACTPEGEPLEGDARIVCAPGTLESSGACTGSESPTVRETLTCESYASSGDQVLSQETGTCAADAGAECCVCSFEVDVTCDPCVTND